MCSTYPVVQSIKLNKWWAEICIQPLFLLLFDLLTVGDVISTVSFKKLSKIISLAIIILNLVNSGDASGRSATTDICE